MCSVVDDVGRLAGSWLVVNDGSAPAVTIGSVRLDFSDDGRLVAYSIADAGSGAMTPAAAVGTGTAVGRDPSIRPG